MRRRFATYSIAGLVCVAVTAGPAAAHWSAPPGPREPAAAQGAPPVCAPGGEPVVLDGTAAPEDESTYRLHPFEVAAGTTRIEVLYDYGDGDLGGDPGGDTVVDLGLWDVDGTAGPDAFRGWGGSHAGVAHKGHTPIWIQADSASRGFGGGTIEPGVWHAETGFGNVADGGGWFRIEITCTDPATGPPPPPDPVDRTHIAIDEPGWYHGDFHMHAYHSSPDGPEDADVVAHAREVGLDFLPITEYVTTWHHQTWGSVARANPDVIVWPGREVITYGGHAIVLGETPNSVEYRRGFRQITMAEIQQAAIADGALFGIPHPTIFPEPTGDLCRGCYAEYLDEIDLDQVTTIEVLTGPVSYDPTYFGGPATGPAAVEFPFMQTAIDLWEDLLLDGHRVTAVSGSDAKDAAGHGINATAVWAESLSRDALIEGLRNQRAYVRTRGAIDSPELDLTATDGSDTVMIGGTLVADQATLSITLRGAVGHEIDVVRDGLSTTQIPVPTDPFTVDVPMVRSDDSGPLGTFYRVDVRDFTGIRSIVSNPIYLVASPADSADGAGTDDGGPNDSSDDASGSTSTSDEPGGGTDGNAAPGLPATGAAGGIWLLGLLSLGVTALARRRG